jgi:hypothetical protein
VLIVAHCLRTEAYGTSEINGAESFRQPSILFFKYSVKLSAHLKRDRSTKASSLALLLYIEIGWWSNEEKVAN